MTSATSAIKKISLHENCRWNGSDYFHVRVYLDYAKELEIAEEIAKAYNSAHDAMFGFCFKLNGLDIEIQDGEVIEKSGWQALIIGGHNASLLWDEARSWIDLTMQKGFDTVEGWMESCVADYDAQRKLPDTFWIEAAHVVKKLTASKY